MSYGAPKEAWEWFAVKQGLMADLLPIVSNPNAPRSPHTGVASPGKVPTIYNKNRQFAGLLNWSSLQATRDMVREWASEPDYGFGVQGRTIRAFDVDVENPEVAQQIEAEIQMFLLADLPARRRQDSSKMLLGFRMPGAFPKRRLQIKGGGVLEFLGDGCQWVAVGTHPKGARYEWPDGWPVFPEIAAEDFEALCAHLHEKFGEAEWTGVESRPGTGAEDREADDDDVVLFLENHPNFIKRDRKGHVLLECPWKHEHTSDSGPTQTQYRYAGSGGYELGWFNCKHAHCSDRTRHEFLDALGYYAADFDIVPVEPEVENLPEFTGRTKAGTIKAVIEQVTHALRYPNFCGARIAYDEFRDAICISDRKNPHEWRDMLDHDQVTLRINLAARTFEPVSREMMKDAVNLVAYENRFDSALAWIKGLQWDGKKRVERFYSEYFGVEDGPYSRAVGLYTWSALAGRVLQPGVKADMVPILEGEQGIRKSTAVEAMCPTRQSFVEIGFRDKEDDMSRKMRGALVAEIAELDGLHTREIEAIKKFITRTHEKWIPKFKEFSTTFPRRLIFIGTTNKRELLADETGNRRWLPMHVERADADRIAQDRDQLWAEAAVIFKTRGVCWQGLDALSVEAHEEYQTVDLWEEAVFDWLDRVVTFDDERTGKKNGEVPFKTAEVLYEALQIPTKDASELVKKRIGKILRKAGYVQKTARIGHKPTRAWVNLAGRYPDVTPLF